MLIDLTQTGVSAQGIPQYTAFPGGAPANVAVAAAKLGAHTAFIGKVGNDAFGRLLLDTVRQNGVNADGMVISDTANTTLAVVSLQENGERSYMLKNTHILHFGSVSLTDEPSRSATLYAARRVKEYGASVTYDPNYRASLWEDEATAVQKMKEPLDMVDILKISDEELPLLTGTDDCEAGTKQLADAYGIPLILLTLGAKGAYYRFGDVTGHCDGVKVKVADTNGAGDTFFGAFLSAMARLGKYSPSQLSEEEIKSLVDFSNKAAAITASRSGAIPAMPSLAEVN